MICKIGMGNNMGEMLLTIYSETLITQLEFISNKDIAVLRECTKFEYNINFYQGKTIVRSCQIAAKVYCLEDRKLRICFDGFYETKYSKAIITALIAYKNNEKFMIKLSPEITYTFSN